MDVRLYKPAGPDRVAYVSILPASSGEGFLVQVARGPSRAKLGAPQLFGPMSREVADQIVERELQALMAVGFVRGGLADLLAQLDSKKRRRRALAARRLGWLRERAAVEALMALAQKANEELPVVLDALAEIGDPIAVPLARAAAERKLLSRRRAGFEALLKLGDAAALADAKNRALERLPPNVRVAFEKLEPSFPAAPQVTALAEALRGVTEKDRGLALDTTYELGTEVAYGAVREVLATTDIEVPHAWRYTKSILKRAMLRYDARTFGQLAHAVERRARTSKGEKATVKSGFDGEMKSMRVFGKRTQHYVQRMTWRYLRMLARYRPERYANTAAEVLVHYTDDDETPAKGLYGAYASCHLLCRIVYGASNRYELHSRSLRFMLKSPTLIHAPPDVREEAFPGLWDLEPKAYLRVLAGAKLAVVHEFALAAVKTRHMRVVEEAPHGALVGMLGAPYPPTTELALAELRRRFQPGSPDWELIAALVRDAREKARNLGIEWLGQTASLWATSAELVIHFLSEGDASVRAAVASHVVSALSGASVEARRAIAKATLAAIRTKEAVEGAHDAHARIAVALAKEIAEIVPVDELISMVQAASAAERAAGAAGLAVHPDADRVVGTAELLVLAAHPQVSVRDAARALFARRIESLRRDPSPLYALLESEWSDMRAYAATTLKTSIDTAHLSLDALVGLADSNHTDVQDLAKELIGRRIQELPTQELTKKLVEHPHRNMRRYALELVRAHLRPGFVPLASVEELFRSIFLDVSPERPTKRAAIAFLRTRGLEDEEQAGVAARLLGELVRTKTLHDQELALEALAQIALAFPGLASGLRIRRWGRVVIVEFKYKGQSAVVQGLTDARIAFATNTVRETAFFKGALGRPLVFREAMGALHDVVLSDFKYHPRDRFEFTEWLRKQDEKFVAGLAVKNQKARARIEELEAEKAALDAKREARLRPFYQERARYFDYVFTHQYELNYLFDPVITVHPDELFFEAFSKDESSYARLGARYDIFERIDAFECGTTNIDFSARLATELDRIRTYRRAEFDVAPGGFEVKVGSLAAHKEKKIDLPESWVNGFLQVQSTMAMGLTKLRIAPIDLFNMIRFLRRHRAKTSPRAMRYELVPGKRVKVVFEPWEHVVELTATAVFDGPKAMTVRTWGRDRLKILARLLPIATSVDVYLAGLGLPSIYVLDLGGLLSFTLGLSGWTENDWTGGAKFDLLTRRLEATPEELMLVYETLRGVRRAKDTDLAMRTKLGVEKTRSALSYLCQVGRSMLNLSTGTYRHRDLFLAPFTLKDAVKATKPVENETRPEAKAARAIFEAGDVRIIARRPFSGGFKVSGSARSPGGARVRPQITVNHEGEITEGSCTCTFHKSHGLTKGPCEHLLALRLAHMARLETEDDSGKSPKGDKS